MLLGGLRHTLQEHQINSNFYFFWRNSSSLSGSRCGLAGLKLFARGTVALADHGQACEIENPSKHIVLGQ